MEKIFGVFGSDGYSYYIKAKTEEEAQKIIDDRLSKKKDVAKPKKVTEKKKDVAKEEGGIDEDYEN